MEASELDELLPVCEICGWRHYPDDENACLGKPSDEWAAEPDTEGE